MQLKVTLLQMDILLGDPSGNGRKAMQLAEGLVDSQFILLPELWSTGYDLLRAGQLAETESGPSFAVMAQIAQQSKAYVGGSILLRRADRVSNAFVLVSPQGHLAATYDKTHLFRLMHEDSYLSQGDRLVSVETAFGPVGLAICYDLRFPEIFRHYALTPVDFNLLVAEWPRPRLEHWRTLVRARAIENQCYVFACNRVGKDLKSTFFGHSLVVDPWGETLLEADEYEGAFSVEIDTTKIGAARAKIPALSDRRTDLY